MTTAVAGLIYLRVTRPDLKRPIKVVFRTLFFQLKYCVDLPAQFPVIFGRSADLPRHVSLRIACAISPKPKRAICGGGTNFDWRPRLLPSRFQ